MPEQTNPVSSQKKQGFDTEKYLDSQSREITRRIGSSDGRLYLEFGGKLCSDLHAARVLPGYLPDAKIRLFMKMAGNVEIIYCLSARDIQRGKMRGDSGLTYDQQTLKDIEDIRENGLDVSCVAVTIYNGESLADRFIRYLKNLGIKVHVFTEIKGYPNDIDSVVSESGYGSQPYIKIEKPLVVVTGPGGGSGKMFLCLSQIYHDHKNNLMSGFAKFETFPIWNLPIDHPVNVAYEAATADLGDYNMIDPFHRKEHGVEAVNYNRDVENFSLLKKMLERIWAGKGVVPYMSPTDMGINKARDGIMDDEICRESARQEIIRRYFRYKKEFFMGMENKETVHRIEEIMKKSGLCPEDRKVVIPARKASADVISGGKGNRGIFCGAAIQLPDGRIVSGKNSPLLHASSAAVINAIKELADIPDGIPLIDSSILGSIDLLKTDILGMGSESLNVDEVLIALSVSSSVNPTARRAIETLKRLSGCEMHVTHMLTSGDESGLRKIGLNVTTDALATIKYAASRES
jgi:uncharacterized protein (UPF0371 family)